MHAKNPCAGKKSHDVHTNGRHVAIVIGNRVRSERRTGAVAGTRRVANELGDYSLARRADENGISELHNSWQLDEDSQ